MISSMPSLYCPEMEYYLEADCEDEEAWGNHGDAFEEPPEDVEESSSAAATSLAANVLTGAGSKVAEFAGQGMVFPLPTSPPQQKAFPSSRPLFPKPTKPDRERSEMSDDDDDDDDDDDKNEALAALNETDGKGGKMTTSTSTWRKKRGPAAEAAEKAAEAAKEKRKSSQRSNAGIAASVTVCERAFDISPLVCLFYFLCAATTTSDDGPTPSTAVTALSRPTTAVHFFFSSTNQLRFELSTKSLLRSRRTDPISHGAFERAPKVMGYSQS
jgi:hypothetical protein